eukprot:6149520-Pyramimonas_sp.AAC.1
MQDIIFPDHACSQAHSWNEPAVGIFTTRYVNHPQSYAPLLRKPAPSTATNSTFCACVQNLLYFTIQVPSVATRSTDSTD